MLERLYRLVFGAPRDPLDKKTRSGIALTAFLAWVGLGADGLSSSCYGPQEAFLALGQHPQLALYLAVATALTVFIISFAYNQVIELFPNGGGGYKVATRLISPHAGLVTGSALIADYILTIVISIASGTDALYSMLPMNMQIDKIVIESLAILVLVVLNIRGIKESIKILLPIFIGFAVTHLFMISYGIAIHGDHLPRLLDNAISETQSLAAMNGSFFVMALFLHAYSIGGGTYTGLEAVSNNVNTLAEPRVRTGKWAMFYMAISLAFTASGIILLYLLWNVQAEAGQTLNAIVFRHILGNWQFSDPILAATLLFEAGLLFISANTGFLGGPSVLANMAMDQWVPNRFRNLSSRLVTQNGVLLFGVSAILVLMVTGGNVGTLVILYSINVFLAFTMSLLGLCRYWWQKRARNEPWFSHFMLSSLGLIICAGIFITVIISRFMEGGWEAIAILGVVITSCLLIKKHYKQFDRQLFEIDKLLTEELKHFPEAETESAFDKNAPTAVFFIGKSRGAAMHTLLWVQRLFPGHFKNFIFVSVGSVDVKSYGGEKALQSMQDKVEMTLSYFMNFARKNNIFARSYSGYGIDPVSEVVEIAEKINRDIPNAIFFASQFVLDNDNWFTRRLHSETAFAIQRKLHLLGMHMVILPMKLSATGGILAGKSKTS